MDFRYELWKAEIENIDSDIVETKLCSGPSAHKMVDIMDILNEHYLNNRKVITDVIMRGFFVVDTTDNTTIHSIKDLK